MATHATEHPGWAEQHWPAVLEQGMFVVSALTRSEWDEWTTNGFAATDISAALPAHERVIGPLVRGATSVQVFAPSEALVADEPALEKKGRSTFFAPDGDPLHGHERFWNSFFGRHHGIVIATTEAQAASSLVGAADPIVLASEYQLAKGVRRSAIKAARAHATAGRVAVAISGNNGLGVLAFFAEGETLHRLFLEAVSSSLLSE